MVEENDPFIIDIGTGTVKAGSASDDAPRYNIPTVVGIPDKKKGLLVGMDQKDAYIGIEAFEKEKLLDMYYPVKGGAIVLMDKIELIMQHIEKDQLNVDLADYNVMLTEPPLNDRKIREATLELM